MGNPDTGLHIYIYNILYLVSGPERVEGHSLDDHIPQDCQLGAVGYFLQMQAFNWGLEGQQASDTKEALRRRMIPCLISPPLKLVHGLIGL